MITENEAELRVQLRLPQATCKARDRRETGAACCGIILTTSRADVVLSLDSDSLNGYNVTLSRFNGSTV